MEDHLSSLTLAVALAAGVACQVLARHLRIPAIILLLATGTVLGPELLGWVHPDSLGYTLYALVEFGMAVILFEGGLNIQGSRLRRQERTIRRLITVGALVTMLGAGLAAHYILGWHWKMALLFGSLVVVTGPTVVTPLLRGMRLQPRLQTILEAEGVLIDPIGAILAALMLQIVLIPTDMTNVTSELGTVGMRFGFGFLAGLAGGFLLGGIYKLRHLVPHNLENIFALVYVLLLFNVCEHFYATSGILAVTVAGIAVGYMTREETRELREFKDQITLMLVGVLFILLAADIQLADIRNLGWGGVGVVAVLVLVVRPLCVLASTWKSELNWREKTFTSWIAPRGIVAAAIASLTVDVLEREGFEGGAALRGMVFLTIASTVVLAGLSATPVASLLKLRLPSRNRYAILGSDGLGLALADELKRQNIPVVFIDSDPNRCSRAQERGHLVVYGDALEERTMMRARFDLVETAIGLTGNDHLNSLFIGHAREWFAVPRGYVALGLISGVKKPQHVQRHDAEVLFDGPHDTERWDVRQRHGDLMVDYFIYDPPEEESSSESKEDDGPPVKSSKANERFVILAIQRAGKISPMHVGYKLKKGDVAAVAIFQPEREEAVKTLQTLHWKHPAASPVPKKKSSATKEKTA